VVAISRIGASTPEATNTAAAAVSSACSFLSASARLLLGDACADGLAVDIKPSPSGTLIRFDCSRSRAWHAAAILGAYARRSGASTILCTI
jgi:hypothetical protein